MQYHLPLAFMRMPGGIEWVIIGLIAILLFGNRLPGVARGLGRSINEFKSGFSGKYQQDGSEKSDAMEK